MGIPNSTTEKSGEQEGGSVSGHQTSTHVSQCSTSGDADNQSSVNDMTRTEKKMICWEVQKRQSEKKVQTPEKRYVQRYEMGSPTQIIQTNQNPNCITSHRKVSDYLIPLKQQKAFL